MVVIFNDSLMCGCNFELVLYMVLSLKYLLYACKLLIIVVWL